ncbi:MAG TPA: hypothetical protein VE870_17245, partial [Bacteroidales bacterium]|nr:hypothetical protein [Bacteroidales bacterium]
MRSYLFLLLLFVSGIYSLSSFAQEEFFNDHNGLSFQYSKLLDADLDANLYGISAYFNKGFIVGFAMENADQSNYPHLGFLICPNWDDGSRPLKLAIGPSYAHASGNHIIGIDA